MGRQYHITNDFQRDNFINEINANPYPQLFEVKALGRSLSQNALFHMWVGQAAHFFKLTPEQMKMVFKHQFLGYEDCKIGKLDIKGQLRRTSKLDKGEMNHFMSQVDAWCAKKNCLLTTPADSDYMNYKEAQNA